MIICTADKSGRILSFSYGKHVGLQDMRRCLETVEGLMHSLKAGFVVISDLSHLESMDPACALPMGTLMDLCSAGGVSSVVRVIPDPTKDIGFNIIARFHMPAPVRMETHEGLAEAINSVAEHFETAHA